MGARGIYAKKKKKRLAHKKKASDVRVQSTTTSREREQIGRQS